MKSTGLADHSVQVGVAIIDNKEHRRVHGQAYGMDVDINDKKPAKPWEISHDLLKFAISNVYFAKSQRIGCGC